MAEKVQNGEKTPKTQKIAERFKSLKAEFKKIIWPNQQSVVRQTAAVVSVSVVTGLIIAVLDWLIQYGVNFLVGFSF